VDAFSDVTDYIIAAVSCRAVSDIVLITESKLGVITVDDEDGVWYQDIELSEGTSSLSVEDLNNDTFLDGIVSTNIGVPIVINDGTGYLYLDQILPSYNTILVATGDLDGDTFKEIITCNTDGEVKLWLNDGYGNYSVSSQVIQAGDLTSITVEDRNEDMCPGR
jgi:hypothetical protein